MPNKEKSICIIGGGFYGCYIAKKIIENYKNVKVEIYEKSRDPSLNHEPRVVFFAEF